MIIYSLKRTAVIYIIWYDWRVFVCMHKMISIQSRIAYSMIVLLQFSCHTCTLFLKNILKHSYLNIKRQWHGVSCLDYLPNFIVRKSQKSLENEVEGWHQVFAELVSMSCPTGHAHNLYKTTSVFCQTPHKRTSVIWRHFVNEPDNQVIYQKIQGTRYDKAFTDFVISNTFIFSLVFDNENTE